MSVPRIRVDGFNKNFEKKIFGEIVRSESTRMYIKSVVSDLGKYEVIQQGDIPILGYSDDQPFEKYKSVILFGDHTLSLYRPKAPFLLATDGIKILQSTILKRDYLYYLTQNYIPKSQGYKRHFSVLKQVFVNYSQDSSEQSAIGSLFRTLDDLLASYKDNLANYQSLKATMLSIMFPKAGQSVPEIRLDGFEGEWKKVKLKDITESIEYGLNASAKEFDGKNKYIRITDIDDVSRKFKEDSITSPDINVSECDNYLLCEKDILFARTGASVGKTYLYDIKDGKVYFAGFLIRARIKEKFDSKFIFQNTLTDRFTQYVKVTSQRSGQPGVNGKEYGEYELYLPKYEEQQAIGAYFSNLDNLIAAHQEKISQLETLKKKLLQDMFI